MIIASADCWGPKLRSRTVLGLSRFLPWAVLALCCTVFLLTARRGLDLTDESFYLVSCRDWRTTFSTSLFGAYLGGPFHLLGENIAAFRVFGAGLLLVSAWHFFWALDRLLFPGVPDNGGRPAGRIEFLGAGVASIFSFYALEPTLRVPSYNLLVLVCLMSSTGFLLTVLAGPRDRKATASLTLGGAYGATLSILAFTKLPAVVLLLPLHLLLFLCFRRQLTGRQWVLVVVASALGAALNVVGIRAVCPTWIHRILVAKTALFLREDRNLLRSLGSAVKHSMDEVGDFRYGFALIFGLLLLAAILRGRRCDGWRGPVALGASGLVALRILTGGQHSAWWLMFLALGLVLFLALAEREPVQTLWRTAVIALVLVLLPIANSFGTTGAMLPHGKMASVFLFAMFLMLLRQLLNVDAITQILYRAASAILVLPMLYWQIAPIYHGGLTYRLATGLNQQTEKFMFYQGNGRLLLDRGLCLDLQNFQGALFRAGFGPGTAMFDMTGDNPGLVYVADGRAQAAAWMLGGYPGSRRAAGYLLSQVDSDLLRRAWILSCDESPRGVEGWRELWGDRLGGFHHEWAGSVIIHTTYAWDTTPLGTPRTIKIWKPTRDKG